MDRYKRDTGAYKASINNAAIELFLSNMEEYKINFRYFITIEFIPGKGTDRLIDRQIKHLDYVNKALFSKSKRNVDTPGLIYIKERYNHNRSEFHLHVFLEEVTDTILHKHIDETFLVSSKSEILPPDQFTEKEAAFVDFYTQYLRRKMKDVGTSQRSIEIIPVYEIDGLIKYGNKSILLEDITSLDHVDIHRGIFNDDWRQNRGKAISKRISES
jgi:hypothetical protein